MFRQPLVDRLTNVFLSYWSRDGYVSLDPGCCRPAYLVVEREVGDIDGAHGTEHSARLPTHLAAVGHDGSELAIVSVDLVRPGSKHGTT